MFAKIKLPLIALTAVVFIVCGYQMTQLPLWGHRPLVLFASFWMLFTLLLAERWFKAPNRLQLLGWSTLAGVLLSLGFPVSPLTPLMFVGFVPLLMVEKSLADTKNESSKRELFKYTYHAFVVWNILTTYWVSNSASFVAGIIAIWLNSFFMTIPFLLFHQTRKVMPRNFMYLAFIANWLAWEYLHLRWEISWPWLTLGNSFAQYPEWVQWYEYTGVFGGSLWILLVNLLIFLWIVRPLFFDKKRLSTFSIIKIMGLLLLPILFSYYRFYSYQPAGKPAEVVVIQPNYEPHYQKFSIPQTTQLERFLELSQSAVTDSTDFLVFPETSFWRLNKDQLEQSVIIRRLRQFLQKYPQLSLVSGISAYKIYDANESGGNAIREQADSRTGNVIRWESYNAAIHLRSGEEIDFYKKAKLVPGAEITPYKEIFFFLKPVIDQLGGTLEGLGIQSIRSAFKSPAGAVGPVICYESVYGEYATGYIKQGAQALFIVTNDGWWDNTPGHKQHLKFASLRAIETRRDIARSANTGISGFVNQKGKLRQLTKYETPAAVKGTILMNDAITFYVRWGDIIGRLAVFTFFLLLLNTIVKGRMRS